MDEVNLQAFFNTPIGSDFAHLLPYNDSAEEAFADLVNAVIQARDKMFIRFILYGYLHGQEILIASEIRSVLNRESLQSKATSPYSALTRPAILSFGRLALNLKEGPGRRQPYNSHHPRINGSWPSFANAISACIYTISHVKWSLKHIMA